MTAVSVARVGTVIASEAKQSIWSDRYRHNGSELPLPLWERVGVRGHGLSIERNPSPGSHLTMRSDLSHRGRGNALSRVRRLNFQTAHTISNMSPHSRGMICP